MGPTQMGTAQRSNVEVSATIVEKETDVVRAKHFDQALVFSAVLVNRPKLVATRSEGSTRGVFSVAIAALDSTLVSISPNNTLNGMIAWDDMKAIARATGSLNPAARTFKMRVHELGGQGRSATVDGTVRQDGWMVANVNGQDVACTGITVQQQRDAESTCEAVRPQIGDGRRAAKSRRHAIICAAARLSAVRHSCRSSRIFAVELDRTAAPDCSSPVVGATLADRDCQATSRKQRAGSRRLIG